MEHTNNPRNSNHVFQSKLSTFPLINIVQASYMNRVSHTSLPFESSFLYLYDYVRVPILNRIRVRCLKSSSFYFVGSNNNKGLTRKSKNRKKENGGITASKWQN